MSGVHIKDKKYFSIGSQYKIYDYEKDYSHILEIKGRKGNWLSITIDGILREARVYPVVNPLSEYQYYLMGIPLYFLIMRLYRITYNLGRYRNEIKKSSNE